MRNYPDGKTGPEEAFGQVLSDKVEHGEEFSNKSGDKDEYNKRTLKHGSIEEWEKAAENDRAAYIRMVDICFQNMGKWGRRLPFYGVVRLAEVTVSLNYLPTVLSTIVRRLPTIDLLLDVFLDKLLVISVWQNSR